MWCGVRLMITSIPKAYNLYHMHMRLVHNLRALIDDIISNFIVDIIWSGNTDMWEKQLDQYY